MSTNQRRVRGTLCRALLLTGMLGARVLLAGAQPGAPGSMQTTTSPASVLQPGDKVQLRIWREPDMSGDFVVDENGRAVFPKVGSLHIADLRTDSLKTLLVSKYAASLRSPAVEVTLLRRVNVLGAVRSPGVYYVDLTTTIANLLAMAGGVNPEGSRSRVDLLRNGARVHLRVDRGARLDDAHIQSGDQLSVPERSWLTRNTALISAGVTAVALIISSRVR